MATELATAQDARRDAPRRRAPQLVRPRVGGDRSAVHRDDEVLSREVSGPPDNAQSPRSRGELGRRLPDGHGHQPGIAVGDHAGVFAEPEEMDGRARWVARHAHGSAAAEFLRHGPGGGGDVIQILGQPQHWTLSVLITDQAIYQSNLPFAAAMAIFLLAVSLPLVGLTQWLGRRRRPAT